MPISGRRSRVAALMGCLRRMEPSVRPPCARTPQRSRLMAMNLSVSPTAQLEAPCGDVHVPWIPEMKAASKCSSTCSTTLTTVRRASRSSNLPVEASQSCRDPDRPPLGIRNMRKQASAVVWRQIPCMQRSPCKKCLRRADPPAVSAEEWLFRASVCTCGCSKRVDKLRT